MTGPGRRLGLTAPARLVPRAGRIVMVRPPRSAGWIVMARPAWRRGLTALARLVEQAGRIVMAQLIPSVGRIGPVQPIRRVCQRT